MLFLFLSFPVSVFGMKGGISVVTLDYRFVCTTKLNSFLFLTQVTPS